MRALLLLFLFTTAASAADKPNILWITCEDSSPHFGCYDDPNASTPNIDALARKGLKFRHAWSNAPVCAPARTCIISGRWAPSDGAEHMRSEVSLPEGHKMFPQLLRDAGYYCSNNAKEDYNLVKPDGVWDESSAKAHWKNRKPGQPFFSVFNILTSHESKIRARPHTLIHDPAKVKVPPYMPDTPEVRHDWAQHFDNLTTMDGEAAAILKELENDGLAEDTIVFFFADHGTGMPRSKRWPCNSGLQVPFITYFPEKFLKLAPFGYRPGFHSDQMIGFIDLAPTVLNIASISPPAYMQGRAFAGENKPVPRSFNFGFRGRMDERVDCTRSITDGRYIYIRNYMPRLPYGQHISYMFEMPTTKVWHDLFEQGKLNEYQSVFWKPKPVEEMYDLVKDPWEMFNLIDHSDFVSEALNLRVALAEWMEKTRDLGLIPEAQRLDECAGKSPRDVYAGMTASDYRALDDAAAVASDTNPENLTVYLKLLKSAVPAMRFWALNGIINAASDTRSNALDAVRVLLTDTSPSVRIAASEVLMMAGTEADQTKAWEVLLTAAEPKNGSAIASVEALNVIDRMGTKAAAKKDAIAKVLLVGDAASSARTREYPPILLAHIAATLGIELPKAGKKGT